MKKLYRRMLKQRPRVIAVMLALMIIVAVFPTMVIAEDTDNAGTTVTPTDAVVVDAPEQSETVSDTDAADIQPMMALGAAPGTAMPAGTKLQVTMTTANSSMSFDYVATDTVYVDWGDGEPVEYTSGDYRNIGYGGRSIKVYCDGDITELQLSYIGLCTLDVTNCSGLEELRCDSNQLTELDVTKNTALTDLDCEQNQLTELDVTKNTALTDLDCKFNHLSELDVTKNTALAYLDCSDNQLTELDVTKNTALAYLDCCYNQLTELDVTKITANTALTDLRCYSNQLTELDVTKNTALTNLDCGHNQLTKLDVTKNTALTSLSCYENQLTELDVTKNTALTFLDVDSNQLTKLDVTKNAALTWLICSGNKLTELDMTKNTELTNLYCAANQLTELDVTKNTALTNLYCTFNQLTKLDVTKNTALTDLRCYSNQLTELDLTKNTEITYLWCSQNKLTFSNIKTAIAIEEFMGNLEVEIFDSHPYDPQAAMTIPTKKAANAAIDLSSEWNAHGKETVYEWYDSEGYSVMPTTSSDGIFTFDESFIGKELYCKMTNASLPELTLETTMVTVVSASAMPTDAKLQVTMTTEDSSMSFHYEATDKVYVDWGNGNPVEYTSGETAAVSGTIKVYSNGDITEFFCSEAGLTELDVTNATALVTLACISNQLTALDVSHNTALKNLGCAENQLTALNLSNNPALYDLYCDNNQLTALDLSNNTALDVLACGDNKITNLDLSKNTKLTRLYCHCNLLTSLDLSNNNICDLSCHSNQIETLNHFVPVFDPDTEYLNSGWFALSENRLTFADLFSAYEEVLDSFEDKDYSYSPQAPVTIPAMVIVGNTIDLSSEYNANDTETIYTWYNAADDTVLVTQPANNSGIFTFDESFVGKRLYCKMTNASLPELTLTTTETAVVAAEPIFGDPQITFTSDNETVNFRITSNDTLYVDWGDGDIVEEGNHITGTVLGTVKVYCNGDITEIKQYSGNGLTSLDVSNCTALTYLVCWDNLLTELNASNCTELTHLECGVNQLTKLDVSNCTALTHLECYVNQLTKLDASSCTALTHLDCRENQLAELDVSNCTALTYLDCRENQLAELDVSNCTALHTLFCNENQLIELDVSKNTALSELNCYMNQLTKLDVSKNTELSDLHCFANQLTELDVSNNLALYMLNCGENQLTELDLSNNTELYDLICSENQLTELDLSNNTALCELRCFYNQITDLDVSNCTALCSLDCADNKLTSIDVSCNPELEELFCKSNKITELDISNNPQLRYLWCDSNDLTELDVSGNPALVWLHCHQNQLTFADLVPVEVIEERSGIYSDFYTYTYSPQAPVTIHAQVSTSETIDLSSEYNANDTETIYTWYNAADDTALVTQPANNSGIFTFDESLIGKKLYCKMTNASLPELTLETTEVEIIAKPVMSLEVIDNMNVDASAGLSDDISVVDGNGDGYIGKLKLIIGNVAGNTKNTVLDAIEAYNKEFKASEDNYAMYDISLFDADNKKVEIVDGRVRITLKIPDNLSGKGKNYTFKLYHYDEDAGKLEEVAITLSNGSSHYTFYADDFSPYALVYKEKKSEGSANSGSGDAKTGDSSGSALAMALNLFMLAALAVYAFRPKSKERA